MNVIIAYANDWRTAQEYLKIYGDFDIEWEEMAYLGNSIKPFIYITRDLKNKFIFFTDINISNWYKEVSPADHVSYVFLSDMRATLDYIKLYEVFLPTLYAYQQTEINHKNCHIWCPIKKNYQIIKVLRALNEHKTPEDHKLDNITEFYTKKSQ